MRFLCYAGRVSIGGQSELPLGHAGLGDKLIGKTEKVSVSLRSVFIRLICPQVVGKFTNNPGRHERESYVRQEEKLQPILVLELPMTELFGALKGYFIHTKQ